MSRSVIDEQEYKARRIHRLRLLHLGVSLPILSHQIRRLADTEVKGGRTEVVRGEQRPVLTQRAVPGREFVLEFLRSRKSKPSRTREEWIDLVSALDSWYTSDREDCMLQLSAERIDGVLQLLLPRAGDWSSSDLLSLGLKTTSSQQRVFCFDELWDRVVKKDLDSCLALYNSIPPFIKGRYKDRLLSTVVSKAGSQCIEKLGSVGSITSNDVLKAYSLLSESDPVGARKLVTDGQASKVRLALGDKIPSDEALLSVADLQLPPVDFIKSRLSEPPSMIRDAAIASAAARAVLADPSVAPELLRMEPGLAPLICVQANRLAKENPSAAASVLNGIESERLRVSNARRIALLLNPIKAEQFVNALSDPLTQSEALRALTDAKN